MKRDPLAWAALAAALAVTASAEYALARAAGFGEWTAAALPAALDIYAVRALRARRDVAPAVAAMIATNAAAHLAAAGLLPVDWPLVVAVSAIAPLVLWRVHRLADHVEAAIETPIKQPRVEVAPVTVRSASGSAGHPAALTGTPPIEVASEQSPDNDCADTVPQASPLVICGAHHKFPLEGPSNDTDGGVTVWESERLSTGAARVVLESCWATGTPVTEAARLATRSTSYVKKVFARLNESCDPATTHKDLALAGEE
ncbi:hypothetical protein [Streptomyces sp. WG5]|uniref:hypothetical protein n=1 Tax=Streptomyces sp. WG5 TaxID=3417648 RepID=UPI003CEDDD2A